ncbi:LpxA family transferase [Pseudomonas sp. Leaf127]|uniref:LpxA family transferase n=1 Tax=Pseudomonas TaxID=286 RepID=UPI0007037C24|nr:MULTISPECIES: LpxA family transferase [Pseudomonas]KQQ56192.1 LpxA family transferase [Pseudomonas sp. Leaf127]
MEYVTGWSDSALADWHEASPWSLMTQAAQIVTQLIAGLPMDEYRISDQVAVHRSATVEPGAVLKGPLIVGPDCFIASGAYLRGGCWLQGHCVIGPGAELKTSFMFAGSKLAHFNFVGDSILGSGVNLEAGSIVCNYRNERADKQIRVYIEGALHGIGHDKFGALIGDGVRLGANAVVAPGALLTPGFIVPRGQVFDAEQSR